MVGVICPECNATDDLSVSTDTVMCRCGAVFTPYLRCHGCTSLFPRGDFHPEHDEAPTCRACR